MSLRRETLAWEWLQANMPIEIDQALYRFVSINPRQKGIEWWDALEIMLDSDAHLEFIEPMSEVMHEWSVPLHAYVVLTLLYASKEFATDYTEEQRIAEVRRRVAHESRTL